VLPLRSGAMGEYVMRLALAVLGLLLLGACTTPTQTASTQNKSDLNKYIEPTNGAAYSQGDVRYYNSDNPPYSGGGMTIHK
jgi:hypothetical protein